MASKTQTHTTLGFESDARQPRVAGLLLFDLDDTLVQAGTYVSPRVMDALRRARSAGYVLSVASGRPVCLIQKDIRRSGVMDYAVCANGSEVVRLADGEALGSTVLSAAEALDCHEMLAPYKPAWNAFFGGKAYFEWKGASYMLTGRTGALARTSRYTAKSKPLPLRLASLAKRGVRYVWRMVSNGSQRQVRSIRPHLRNAADGVNKLGCTIPNAQACLQAEALLRSDGRFEVVRMGATELEITARGVTKATGAQALMDALGIDASHAVAFGDGGNDLPLTEVVGRFIAMGNADDEVKAAATEVCPRVDEDGVAVWIEQNLL